ncbi:MAG: hypothetical protein ACLQIB_22420 [Isosphaeraceae bacterium]
MSGPLTIDSKYTRDEILVGLGHWSLERRPDQREGVLQLAQPKADAFFDRFLYLLAGVPDRVLVPVPVEFDQWIEPGKSFQS